MQSPFQVVIFSGSDPAYVLQLIRRIHREVPEARVCGVLCEQRAGKPFSARASAFLRNLHDWRFVHYAGSRLKETLIKKMDDAATGLLRFVHGGLRPDIPVEDPVEAIQSLGCSIHITGDYHCEESLQFVRNLKPDLGIVYGTRILKPCLFSIPSQGSINIHKRKVPDYRGGGPVGLWELLDGQAEIGVTVHQVTEKLDAGAVVNDAVIPIGPYDNLTSLALKAHVVGNDLLTRSVADYARGTLRLRPQEGTGRLFKAPNPQQLALYKKDLARRRRGFVPSASRPLVKMMVKSLVALPGVTIRNWRRRFHASYPINILFHHIVSDRPHRMGMSTDYFLKQVRFLQKHYQIVSLREAVRMLRTNGAARPTVVLTFDDGYCDNFINLRAVVEATGVPITMFVSTDHITRQLEFKHDVDAGISGFQPLTWEQLQQMEKDGFEIGSHTRTHFDCGSRDLEVLRREIAGSKAELETRIAEPVDFFSFPFGLPENISPEATAVALATYSCFLSAFGGSNTSNADGELAHLKRWCHPNRIWDLELQIQGALEREPRARAAMHLQPAKLSAPDPTANPI